MIRILLVDDQTIVHQGLKSLLEVQPDLQVVGWAETGQQALEQVAALQPDVVLMDVRMPVMDGVTATQLITQQFPAVKVLVLTTFSDDDYVVRALRCGAKGYLLKDTQSEELAQAIRAIHKGYVQMGPGLMEKAIAPISSPTLPPELGQLTPRERDVLRLIVAGANNREIAATLFITEQTVKNHVTSILNRLGLRDRTQAAVFASHYRDWLE